MTSAPAMACPRRWRVCRRKPFGCAANMNAALIPDGITTDQALMMTDALATAWFGARNADIAPSTRVAIVGRGPIGLMAVDCAFIKGADRAFAIDPVSARRDLARAAGAVALYPSSPCILLRIYGHPLLCKVFLIMCRSDWLLPSIRPERQWLGLGEIRPSISHHIIELKVQCASRARRRRSPTGPATMFRLPSQSRSKARYATPITR